MAEISAAAVKALREETGLPLMDCKKALTECGGDKEAANRLIGMAKQVLEKTPPATPGGNRSRKAPAKKSR